MRKKMKEMRGGEKSPKHRQKLTKQAQQKRHLYCAPRQQDYCGKSAAQHRQTQCTAVQALHPQKIHTAMPCNLYCSATTLPLNCTTPQMNSAKYNIQREKNGTQLMSHIQRGKQQHRVELPRITITWHARKYIGGMGLESES